MCGIAGVYYKKRVNASQKERFKTLVRTSQHQRGPDAFGHKRIKDNFDFYHNRLSIIDLEHAAQPMEDEQSIIVFNGEIYNYKILKDPHENYKYDSDTEVLLKGFAKHKFDFLHQTKSMFGFAHYDKHEEKLTLCRDRIGIKQVYYIDNDEVFAFASTITPLTLFSQKNLNKDVLWGYYLNRAFKAPETIFDDIKELEAGSFITFDTQREYISKQEKWWQRSKLQNSQQDENTVLEDIESLLHTSVKERLVADVSVGSFLSGGVDSGLITAIAAKYKPNLEVFTVAMEDPAYDESAYAKAIAKRYNLRYHEVMLTGREFVDEMQSWITMQDDIVANPSALMLHKLAQLAQHNGYKVMLAGEGADELFAGYASYKRFLYAKEAYKYIGLLKPFAKPISKLFASDSRKAFFVYNLLSNPRFYGTAQLFEPPLIEKLLHHQVVQSEAMTLKEALDRDIKDRVPNDLLTSNGDRAAMGASIEARVPFLAHELVEYTASIDETLFVQNKQMKYLLKKIAQKYIPHENIYRKKVGFEMPMNRWLRDEFKEIMMDLIANSVQKDVLDIGVIEALYKDHLSGKIDAGGKLFAFMSLELSYRHLSRIA